MTMSPTRSPIMFCTFSSIVRLSRKAARPYYPHQARHKRPLEPGGLRPSPSKVVRSQPPDRKALKPAGRGNRQRKRSHYTFRQLTCILPSDCAQSSAPIKRGAHEAEGGISIVKRIRLVLSVAVVAALIIAALAGPASATTSVFNLTLNGSNSSQGASVLNGVVVAP